MSGDTYNRKTEVSEAIWAGERALSSLRNAEDELRGARNWGMLDIFGGNFLTGMLKHSKIDNARQDIEFAKQDLADFRRELADVQDLQYMNIDLGGFLTFADFFFDGFLADMFVQSKIRNAQAQVEEAIRRVEQILQELRRYQ